MNFTTKIPISKSNFPIDYASKIVSLGSCFAENMAEKFAFYKFQNTTNPFGIIFNPVSMERIVQRIVNKDLFIENDIFFHNERWHCFEVHSDVSYQDKDQFLKNLNTILEATHQQIIQSTHVIITYGTSWVYRLKTSAAVVANCHKVPQNQFDKEIVSVEAIEKSIRNTMDLIRKVSPNCHFIFTVSPVRHIKDGFVENQRSKAHLITALQSIMNSKLGMANYFPSYEIVMDELRDYRFYEKDMLHPNAIALDYIWERFCESAISEESFDIMNEVAVIQKGLAHRPFNPNSESHQQFLRNLQQKIEQLQHQLPFLTFS